jgi:hypothetical protein
VIIGLCRRICHRIFRIFRGRRNPIRIVSDERTWVEYDGRSRPRPDLRAFDRIVSDMNPPPDHDKPPPKQTTPPSPPPAT